MAFQLIVLDELHRRALRRDRIIRDRLNPLEKYNEEEIYRKYRFPRHEILRLTDLIANDLNKTNKNHAVPPVLQMCTALRFYATGVIHNVSGDMSGMGIKLLLYRLTINNVKQRPLLTGGTWGQRQNSRVHCTFFAEVVFKMGGGGIWTQDSFTSS